MNLEVQLVGRQWQQSRVRLSAPQDVRTTCAKNALKQAVLQILYFLKNDHYLAKRAKQIGAQSDQSA